ncbi:hypothetical protein PF003_g15870 [Phytophthora fragariae]|nr:hypothetical protein PF003_g15870 [Phytophthora fragariae]
MNRTLGLDLMTNNSLDDPARFPVCVSQWGRRHGSSPAEVWDRLEAVERLQTSELAAIWQKGPSTGPAPALSQRAGPVEGPFGHVSQTSSNIQVNFGSIVIAVKK